MNKKLMKTKGWRKALLLPFVLAFSSVLLLPSCNKSDGNEPEVTEVTKVVSFQVLNAKDTEVAVSDYSVQLTEPSGEVSIHTSSAEDGVLEIDATDFVSGEYAYEVTKDGFLAAEGEMNLDLSEYSEEEGFEQKQLAYMTQLGEYFTVTPAGLEEKSFDNGEVIISIPEGAVTEDIQISVTRVITPFHRNEVSSVEGKFVLDCVHLLPEGTTFEKPITVKFKTPDFALPESENSALQLAYFHEDSQTWELKEMLMEGAYCVSTIDHFSDWFVIVNDYKMECFETEWSETVYNERTESGEGVSTVLTLFPEYTPLVEDEPIPEELEDYLLPFQPPVVAAPIAEYTQHVKVRHTFEHIRISKLVTGTTDQYEEIGTLVKPCYPIEVWINASYAPTTHGGGGGN